MEIDRGVDGDVLRRVWAEIDVCCAPRSLAELFRIDPEAEKAAKMDLVHSAVTRWLVGERIDWQHNESRRWN